MIITAIIMQVTKRNCILKDSTTSRTKSQNAEIPEPLRIEIQEA